jgi:excisionase family DNA binding protein
MRKAANETLTPKQVAQQRGVTLSYIYHELWANRLPGARKVGRAWLIPVSAIHERKPTP